MADMSKAMTMPPPNKRQRINWTSGLKAKTGHEILTEEEMGKQMRITRKNQQVKQEIKINIDNILEQLKLVKCVLSREFNELEEERLSHETALETKLEEKTGKEIEWVQIKHKVGITSKLMVTWCDI